MGARKQQRDGAARKQPAQQQQQQGQLKKGVQRRKKQALSQKVREKMERAVLAARRRKMTVDLMKIEIVTEPDIPEVPVKFCAVLIPTFKFCEEKVLDHFSTFLKLQGRVSKF
jgi:hypothetical protein